MKTEAPLAALASAGIGAAGTVFGVPLLGIIFGLLGGFVVLFKSDPMPLWKAISTLSASTLVGGAIGPLGNAILMAWLTQQLPSFKAPPEYGLSACSLLLGIACQVFWNSIIFAGNRRIRKLGGE